MLRLLTWRSHRLNGWVDELVEDIIREPVRESVHEALHEMQQPYDAPDAGAGDADGGGGRRMRWIVPIAVGLVGITYAVWRWWRPSRDRLPSPPRSTSLGDGPDRSSQAATDEQGETGATADTEGDELEAELSGGEDR